MMKQHISWQDRPILKYLLQIKDRSVLFLKTLKSKIGSYLSKMGLESFLGPF